MSKIRKEGLRESTKLLGFYRGLRCMAMTQAALVVCCRVLELLSGPKGASMDLKDILGKAGRADGLCL